MYFQQFQKYIYDCTINMNLLVSFFTIQYYTSNVHPELISIKGMFNLSFTCIITFMYVLVIHSQIQRAKFASTAFVPKTIHVLTPTLKS